MKNSPFKKSAEERLCQFGGISRRLLLIYSGSLSGLFLLSTLVPMLLSAMNTGGGLSAIGTQAILTTVTVVLRLLPVLLLPFWTAGLRFAMLKLSRGEVASDKDLLEGFHRLGTVLVAVAFQLAQYAMVGYVASSLGMQLFLYTPFGQPVFQAILNGEISALTQLSPAAMLVYRGSIAAVFLLLATPVFYRYRMVDYVIMDGAPALPSLMLSRAMTRRRRLQLFRLDLSFWWVWAGIALTVLAGCAPAFFQLPFGWLDWILPILGAGGQLLIGTFALPKVALTYASCYDTFRQAPAPEPERRAAVPQKLPWEGWQ